MAGAVVQATGTIDDSGGTSTTIAQAFGSNTTTGNLIHVAVGWGDNVAPSGVSDSQSNTYTLIDNTYDGTNGESMATYYAKNITGGTTPTVTVTWVAAKAYRRLEIMECSGLDTATPLNQNVAANQTAPGTGTDGCTSGNMAATTVAGCLIIGSLQVTGAATPGATLTAGTGYTSDNTTGGVTMVEHKYVSSTGTYSATFTIATNYGVITHAVAYADAGGGGGPATPFPPWPQRIFQRAA